MDGLWTCSDLVALVRLLVGNRDLLDAMEGGSARFAGWLLKAWHQLRRNTPTGSRRNIDAHYDLGNPLFQLARASRRDRVCQYVKISVVAVSLQKKIITN